MLLIYIVLYVKNAKDLLQGVSKLDYLIKVSCFQKFKDPEQERRKWSIITGDEKETPQRYLSAESLEYASQIKMMRSANASQMASSASLSVNEVEEDQEEN